MAAALGYRPDATATRLCLRWQQPSYDTDTLIAVPDQLGPFSSGQRVVLLWDRLSAHWSTKMRPSWTASRTGRRAARGRGARRGYRRPG